MKASPIGPGLLSASNPELWREIVRFPAGLQAIFFEGISKPLLVVKLPHQFLLTARMNKGFKIYVVPIEWQGISTVGLFSAFFEDPASPLTAWTPLADEPHTRDLVKALQCPGIAVRMVDEHDRELLGYDSVIKLPLVSRVRLEHANFYPTSHDLHHGMSETAYGWFGASTKQDDAEAISIEFKTPLFDEDRKLRDERPELFKFHGSKGFAEVSLKKFDPGYFQELDIILLLQRIFPPYQIYHSPFQIRKNKEICDVLVISEHFCLIVQAKDSQTTEESLSLSLEKKRSKGINQLNDGCRQIATAIRHLCNTQPLAFNLDGLDYKVDLGKRAILTLVVIREKFEPDYPLYSERLNELYQKIDFPCLALDYNDLIEYCTFCDGAINFYGAYMQVFYDGINTGTFKKLRFGVQDLFGGDGEFRFS